MSRNLSAIDLAEIASEIVGVVEFMQIELPTGNLYLTSGQENYTFGGNTYSPVSITGTPMPILGNYNESTDSTPRPVQVTLSGVDPILIANVVGNNTQWVPITWSIGFVGKGNQLLDTPSFAVSMFLGDLTIALSEGKGTISITGENLLADMQGRFSGMLQTVGDQQARGVPGNTTFSTDTFYAFAASLTYTWIYWGEQGPAQMGVGGADPTAERSTYPLKKPF